MNYCSNCGNDLNGIEAKYCPNCGQQLSGKVEKSSLNLDLEKIKPMIKFVIKLLSKLNTRIGKYVLLAIVALILITSYFSSDFHEKRKVISVAKNGIEEYIENDPISNDSHREHDINGYSKVEVEHITKEDKDIGQEGTYSVYGYFKMSLDGGEDCIYSWGATVYVYDGEYNSTGEGYSIVYDDPYMEEIEKLF